MAELRERSMQAAQVMSQSGVDLTAVANEASVPRVASAPRSAAAATAAASVVTVSGRQPELQLDVPTNRGEPWVRAERIITVTGVETCRRLEAVGNVVR